MTYLRFEIINKLYVGNYSPLAMVLGLLFVIQRLESHFLAMELDNP